MKTELEEEQPFILKMRILLLSFLNATYSKIKCFVMRAYSSYPMFPNFIVLSNSTFNYLTKFFSL